MPRKELMSWEGKPNFRWVKWHANERYVIAAKDLGWSGHGDARDITRDAANDWWIAKLATLAPKPRKQKPKNGLTDEDRKAFGITINKYGEEYVDGMDRLSEMIESRLKSDPKYKAIVNQIIEPTLTVNSVRYWADQYFDFKLVLTDRGAGRYDNLKRSVNRLVTSIGDTQPVTAINWGSWDKFTLDLKKEGKAEPTVRDYVVDCREFVRWLMRRKIIPPVENLAETKVKVGMTKIEHFTKDELRNIIKKSDGILKVFVLLFCNCGFRQSDVSTLAVGMVSGGYLTRQRAKTTGTDAPTVSWKLWPETAKAMKPFENVKGFMFSRDNGLPWVVEGLNEKGTRKRDDAFRRELWLPFTEKHKWRLSADAIRASCANLLKTDSDHTNQLSVQIKYLGQKPSGVALRHYIDPTQEDLDAAVLGLRKILL